MITLYLSVCRTRYGCFKSMSLLVSINCLLSKLTCSEFLWFSAIISIDSLNILFDNLLAITAVKLCCTEKHISGTRGTQFMDKCECFGSKVTMFSIGLSLRVTVCCPHVVLCVDNVNSLFITQSMDAGMQLGPNKKCVSNALIFTCFLEIMIFPCYSCANNFHMYVHINCLHLLSQLGQIDKALKISYIVLQTYQKLVITFVLWISGTLVISLLNRLVNLTYCFLTGMRPKSKKRYEYI